MKFQENVSLSKYSNYKIGGRARFFCEPKNEREITMAVAKAGEMKLPIFILGGGTNLLFRDSGFSGLVLKPAIAKISTGKPTAASKTVSIGAGVSMAELLKYATDKSLSGLEWAGGLPGTVGGAIRGNAGCFGGEIKDVIESVRSFDVKKMKVVERSVRECKFAYRDSIFKKSGARGAANEIILSATLALTNGDKRVIARAIAEKIAHRVKHHPLEYPNIGSIFKNVPVAEIHAEASSKYKTALAAQSLAYRGSEFSVKADPFPVISAAKLISESGLRGVSFGGAMISAKHPNFIVNVLGAEARDVKALMALAQVNVKKKFGVSLEPEVQVV
jgi:UDP-N-acetylmuramate dehydrogenase